MRRLRYLLVALASALLLVAPYHYPASWPLAFIAFVPMFWASREKSGGHVFQFFFVFGVFFWAFLGWWLTNVHWLGFVVLAAYLSVYFGLFGYFSRALLTQNRLRAGLTVSAIWVFLEYVRGWLIGGFPWALLGYSQWKNLPFIQIADLAGAFSVSLAVMWGNVLLYQLLCRQPGPRSRWLVPAVCLSLVFGYGFWTLRAREAFYARAGAKAVLRVSVLQGNIPQEEKWDARIKSIIFEKYKRLTTMAAMEQPDLIVWPETSFPGFLEDEALMAQQLRGALRHTGAYTLVGAPTMGELDVKTNRLHLYNSAVLYGPDGEEIRRYHKAHLVPFGEYVPFENVLGLLRRFVSIGHFSPGREETIFSIVSTNRPTRIAAKFSVLICYEDIFPGLVRERAKKGADFLVNITNDAWFGKTSAPYQHAQASVFRAVENRVPVIRAANTGLSCFITPEGRIAASVQKDGEEIMVSGRREHDVTLRKGGSFYSHWGDLFFWGVLAWLVFAYKERHRQSGYSRV